MTEADEGDARAMYCLIRWGWNFNYIVLFSGYSRDRVIRLIQLGSAIWAQDHIRGNQS